MSAVLITGGGLTIRRRVLFVTAAVLIAVILPMAWIGLLVVESRWIFVATCILESIFCLYLAAILLRNVLARYVATWEAVFGSLAAYLLIGLAWAMLYWATEAIEVEQNPSPVVASPPTRSLRSSSKRPCTRRQGWFVRSAPN